MEKSFAAISMTPICGFVETTMTALEERLSADWTGSVREKSEFMDSDTSSPMENPCYESSMIPEGINATCWDSSISATAGYLEEMTCRTSMRTSSTDGSTGLS